MPSEARIKKECGNIQKGWTAADRAKRTVNTGHVEWSVPIVSETV
jgi:hypothetical protein